MPVKTRKWKRGLRSTGAKRAMPMQSGIAFSDVNRLNKLYGGGPPGTETVDISKPIIDDYYEGTLIGTGGFGKVYSCTKLETNTKYAIKIIEIKNSLSNDLIRNEIFVLQSLKTVCEKYILCFVGFKVQNDTAYIISELLDNYIPLIGLISGGNLTEVSAISEVCNNLLLGLQTIHILNVCHRDIKPANIMVSPTTHDIKYIDFGTACLYIGNTTNSELSSVVGTPNYIYPELLTTDDDELTIVILKKADYFSLGMLFFVLISGGNTPFEIINGPSNNSREVYNFNMRSLKGVLLNAHNDQIRHVMEKERQIIEYASLNNLQYKPIGTLMGFNR